MPAGVTEAKAALRQRIACRPVPDWRPMLERFLVLPEVRRAQTVMLFYGVEREPDTKQIMEQLLFQEKRVVLPRCLPGRGMEGRMVTGQSKLFLNAYGIPEPGESCPVIGREEIDLILVPNLCCDKWGYRLGHGGGYYDRYLSGFAGITVSLCPDEWLEESLPVDELDIPVDIVLTQTQIRRRANALRRISEEGAAGK